MQRISPSFIDWFVSRGDWIFPTQITDIPDGHAGNLFAPPDHPRGVCGPYEHQAHADSLSTRTFEWPPILKPLAPGAAAVGLAALVGGLSVRKRPRTSLERLPYLSSR